MNIIERMKAVDEGRLSGDDTEPFFDDIHHLVRNDLVNYAVHRMRASGFVMAVLNNDLREAVLRSDPGNCLALRYIVGWCRENLPPGSWGSPSAVRAWLEGGEL